MRTAFMMGCSSTVTFFKSAGYVTVYTILPDSIGMTIITHQFVVVFIVSPQVELHVHLDGAIRPQTIFDVAK